MKKNMIGLKYFKGADSNKFIAYSHYYINKTNSKTIDRLIKDISKLIMKVDAGNIKGIEIRIEPLNNK